MKQWFEITYTDPKTNETAKVEKEFEDSHEFPAKMWAEDYGYTLADKGWFMVRELSGARQSPVWPITHPRSG